MLLLSGDISWNPGPIQKDRLKEKWKTFGSGGLHFIHLNLNGLLPKIDEQLMPMVIGITETKIDNSIHT